jgi:hypothetical protein
MLKNKWLKALNILVFVSSTDWGVDSTVLLNLEIVDSIKIGLRMYRLRFSPSILYQVAWYSPSLRMTTLTWSVQNVSSWEFVCWSKRAFHCKQTYQTWYAVCNEIEGLCCIRLCFNPLYENDYDKQPNTIQPFEHRVKSHIENSDINLDDIAPL